MSENLVSINKVTQELDVSALTISNWYGWYNAEDSVIPEDCPGLPPFTRHGRGGKRMWKEKDLEQLKAFQSWIPRGNKGVMGNWNYRRKRMRREEWEKQSKKKNKK